MFSTTTSNDTYTLPNCEVCGAESAAPLLNLGNQAMCDDLVPVGDSRQCKRFPIEISICPHCLTAHQVHRIKKETLFPRNYHYRPRFTQDVLSGMASLVSEVQESFGSLDGKKVVDIGCNDGSLLSIFSQHGALTAGIEPTDAATEAIESGHSVIQGFFSTESASALVSRTGKPDVITFTNVFAHIESLAEAIDALKCMIHDQTLVVIENHYLGTILESFQFDTFYHEHPRTYSQSSFDFIAKSLGGELLNVTFPQRYGGNIRVVIGNFGASSTHRPTDSVHQPRVEEKDFPSRLTQMQADIVQWQQRARGQLDLLKASGVVLHGKSFPGRAAILTHLLAVEEEDLPVVYEKPGSLKIGHYLPGTRIQIASDHEWINGNASPDAMLLWGWHIDAELAQYIRSAGFKGKLFSPLPDFREISCMEVPVALKAVHA